MNEAAPEQAPPQNANGNAEVNALADGLSDAAHTQILEQERKAAAQQLAKIRKQTQTLTSDFDELKARFDDLRKEEDALRIFVNEISTIKTSAEESQNGIEGIQKEVTARKEQIDEITKQTETAQADITSAKEKVLAAQAKVDEETEKATTELQKLTEQQEALKSEIIELKKERDSLQSVLDEIKTIKANAGESNVSVQADIQAINQSKQQFEEMKTQAQASKDDLANKHNEIAGKIAEINSAYDRVVQEHSSLLEDKTLEDGNTAKCIASQIKDTNSQSKALLDETRKQGETSQKSLSDLMSQTKASIEDVKTKIENDLEEFMKRSEDQVLALKTSLEREIRSLLPGAGAAGLAGAYVDAKNKYAPGTFEYIGDRQGKFFWLRYSTSWLWHCARNSVPHLFFYAMFLCPLGFIAYNFYDLFNTFKEAPKEFNMDFWLFRSSLSIPMAAISLFGWSSIRLYRRLYEEYNHKQRVMQLYHSFKEQIDENGTEDHKKALLGVMLAAVGDKPSLAMHKYDKGLEDLFPNLSVGGLLSGMFKGKKEA